MIAKVCFGMSTWWDVFVDTRKRKNDEHGRKI